MLYITNIRMSQPTKTGHDHIAEFKWFNPVDKATGSFTVQAFVAFINKGGIAKVTDGKKTVDVVVVNSTPPYLRTVADGYYTDNLLALPTF